MSACSLSRSLRAQVAVDRGFQAFGGRAGARPVFDLPSADPPLDEGGQACGDRGGGTEGLACWLGQAADLLGGDGEHRGGDAQQQRRQPGLVDALF